MRIVDVTHPFFLQAIGIDAALERTVLHATDRVVHRSAHTFDHRRQYESRCFGILIGVDTDSVMPFAHRTRGLEHAESGRTAGVKNHIYTLLVLTEREFFALAWIAKRFGSDTGVLRDHGTIGTDMFHARFVSRFEFMNERDVHAAKKSDLPGAAHQRSHRADEERAFLFAEFQRGNVRRRRNDVALRIAREREVDACKVDVRVFLCERRQIIAEDKSNAEHEAAPLGGQQSQSRFTIRAVPRLDELDARVEMSGRAVGTNECAVVERLVAASAHVENDADRGAGAGGLEHV